jgi:hypothetical protein
MAISPPGALRTLQVSAGALLLGSAALLAVGAVLGPLARIGADHMVARTVAGVAVGWAVLSPLLAALLTRGTDDASAVPPSVEDVSRRVLLRFALLETGVVLPAAVLLLGPIRWPLYAAFVPLMAMVAAFPREQ